MIGCALTHQVILPGPFPNEIHDGLIRRPISEGADLNDLSLARMNFQGGIGDRFRAAIKVSEQSPHAEDG
jgi:hypothetical protein